jgi:hypothetical protein
LRTGSLQKVLSNQLCHVNKAHGLSIDFFLLSW